MKAEMDPFMWDRYTEWYCFNAAETIAETRFKKQIAELSIEEQDKLIEEA